MPVLRRSMSRTSRQWPWWRPLQGRRARGTASQECPARHARPGRPGHDRRPRRCELSRTLHNRDGGQPRWGRVCQHARPSNLHSKPRSHANVKSRPYSPNMREDRPEPREAFLSDVCGVVRSVRDSDLGGWQIQSGAMSSERLPRAEPAQFARVEARDRTARKYSNRPGSRRTDADALRR